MPLTDRERADLEALSSGQISDAMETLNLRRAVVTGFIMLAPHGSRIVGPAVTVRQIPKNADDARESRLTRHQEVSRNIAKRGDVVVIDNGGRLDTATWANSTRMPASTMAWPARSSTGPRATDRRSGHPISRLSCAA